MNIEKLKQKFYAKYALVQTTTVRNTINEFDWSNRLIGLRGSRGVGKTTLILQYIKLNYNPDNAVLYISLDDMFFSENTLYDLAVHFYNQGGILLAIDEVHRYKNWASEIKNIYDDLPELKIIFTGSSLLHLVEAKADLSRRAVMHDMPGLSLREFIWLNGIAKFKAYPLTELLENHIDISMEIKQKIKPIKFFKDYLNFGYYPFFLENQPSYHQKLSETILTVLEVDIPQFANIQISNIVLLKKLLRIISRSSPFKPNMKSLSERSGISLNTMKHYLKLLTDAELINMLYFEEKHLNSLGKPDKIYLNNTNLMFNLSSENLNIGNARETFFFNQVSRNNKITESKFSDFYVNQKYTFEVGGRNKKKSQIRDIENAFVVKDDIEIGSNNIVPLWLFGFLY